MIFFLLTSRHLKVCLPLPAYLVLRLATHYDIHREVVPTRQLDRKMGEGGGDIYDGDGDDVIRDDDE